MEVSEILNIILGGGLFGTVVAIVTLRSTVRKARAEAVKAEADAETVRVDNAEHATRILIENIVKPLKDELNETRKVLQATQQEIERLREAIDAANDCKHSAGCPILRGMREHKAKSGIHDGNLSKGSRMRQLSGSSGIRNSTEPGNDGAGTVGGDEAALYDGGCPGGGVEDESGDTEPP